MALNATLTVYLNTTEPGPLYNESEKETDPSRMKITTSSILLLSLVICIVGLAGNGIMIFLFSFKIKINPQIIYFLNLAIADSLYLCGLGIFTLCMICSSYKVYISYNSKVIIGFTSEALTNIGFDANSFLLTAIGVERCLSVLFPFYNKNIRQKHQSAIVCAFLWILATLTMILEVFVCNDKGDYLSPEAKTCTPIIIFTTTLFVIVVLLMILSSMVLLFEIQKTSKYCRPPKLYIVILLTLLIFIVSIIPSRVLGLLIYFKIYAFKSHALTFYFIYSVCTAINCSANPYINIMVGRWGEVASMKKAIEKIFNN